MTSGNKNVAVTCEALALMTALLSIFFVFMADDATLLRAKWFLAAFVIFAGVAYYQRVTLGFDRKHPAR